MPESRFQCSYNLNITRTTDDEVGAWEGLTTTASLYGLVGLALLVTFEASRGKGSVYSRRSRGLPHRTPAKPGRWPLQWLLPVLMMPDDEVRQKVGMDGFVCLRYLRWCLKACFFAAFWSCAVLLPVYWTGRRDVPEIFQRLTMDNLYPGSNRMWASTVFSALFTAFVLVTMDHEWRSFVEWRTEFLAEGDYDAKGGSQLAYSIRVESIPKELRSDMALFAYFENLFPGEVHSAVVHQDVSELQSVLDKRQRVVDKLEEAYARRTLRRRRAVCKGPAKRNADDAPFSPLSSDPLAAGDLAEPDEECVGFAAEGGSGMPPCYWESFDSVSHYQRVLAELNEKVAVLQQQFYARDLEMEQSLSKRIRSQLRETFDVNSGLPEGSSLRQVVAEDLHTFADGAVLAVAALAKGVKILTVGESKSSTGFVTFKSRTAAANATTGILTSKSFCLEASGAPDPRDMIWANSVAPATETRTRRWLASAAVFFFGLLWFIPLIGFFNSLGNVAELSQIQGLSWLQDLSPDSIVSVFITTQLPALLQVGFMSSLPVLFTSLASGYEHLKSHSGVQQSILGRYFAFQLVQIYATLISSSLLSVVYLIVQEPSCIFELLGTSIPSTAAYFCQLIIIKAFTGLLVELARPWPLIRVFLFQCFCAETSSVRTKRELRRDTSEFLAGWIFPNFLLVIIIMFLYSSMVPVVTLAASLYFMLAYIIYKHQLLYVYLPQYETGGKLLPILFGYTLTGLNIANITMMGYLGIKGAWSELTTCIAPLFFAVEAYRYYSKRAYGLPSVVLSREAATKADRATTNASAAFDSSLYRQPALYEGPAEPNLQRYFDHPETSEVASPRSPTLGSPLLTSGLRSPTYQSTGGRGGVE